MCQRVYRDTKHRSCWFKKRKLSGMLDLNRGTCFLSLFCPKGEQNKNCICSLTTHTQIAYLSHHPPFISFYFFLVSDSQALTFPILQILRLPHTPVSQCTNRRNRGDGTLSLSLQPIKQIFNCLINDRWPEPQTEDKSATWTLWKLYEGEKSTNKILEMST